MTAAALRSSPASRVLDLLTLWLLAAGAVVLPLVFWPWTSDVFVGPKFDVLRIWTTLTAIAAGGWLISSRRAVVLRTTDAFVTAFLALNVVAYTLSVEPRTSLFGEPLQQAGLITVVALAATYGTARIAVRHHRRLRFLIIASVAGATAIAAYGIIQLIGADPIWPSLPQGRVFSSIGQPNWLAGYLVIITPLTAGLALTTRRTPLRLLAGGVFIAQLTVLLATRSRSGLLGLVVISLVAAIALSGHLRRTKQPAMRIIVSGLVVSALAVVAISVVAWSTPEVAPSNLVRRAVSALDVGGFEAQRYVSLWEVGVAITADHPLTGTGQDTYAILFPSYRDRVLDEAFSEHFSVFRPESPHNVYVAIASGAGLPALLAYLGAVGTGMAALVRRARAGGDRAILVWACVAALAGHLATDFFTTLDLSGSWIFWALLGAGVAVASNTAANERKEVAVNSL